MGLKTNVESAEKTIGGSVVPLIKMRRLSGERLRYQLNLLLEKLKPFFTTVALLCFLFGLGACKLIDNQIRGSIGKQGLFCSAGSFYVMQNSASNSLKLSGADASANGLTLSLDTASTHGAVTLNQDSAVYTPASDFSGVDTFEFVISSGGFQVSCTERVNVMTSYTWTGDAEDGLWSSAANWCGDVKADLVSGCEGATVAPGSSDTAVFDQTCKSHCDATIDSTTSVAGITLDTGYSGTVTVSTGVELTLGATGFTQKSGHFAGSDSAMTVNGPFDLTSGSFKSTSDTLTVVGDVTASSSSSFDANSGTIELSTAGASTTTTSAGSIVFNDLTLNGADDQNLSGIVSVSGKLILDKTGGDMIGGTLAASGDVDIDAAPGTSSTTLLDMVGTASQTITATAGTQIGSFQNDNLVQVELTGTMTVGGDFTDNSNKTSGFNSSFYGNLSTPLSTLVFTTQGTATTITTYKTYGPSLGHVIFEGADDQNLNGHLATTGNVTFEKSAGSIIGTDGNGGMYMESNSTITATTGVGAGSDTSIWLTSNCSFCDYTVNGADGSYLPTIDILASLGTLTLSGTLDFVDSLEVEFGVSVDAGTSTVEADASFSDVGIEGIGQNLTLNNVVIKGTHTVTMGAFSHTLTTTGNITVSGSGSESLAGALTVDGSLSLNGTTLTKNGQTLVVGGTTAGTGSLYGGAVAP